MFSASFEAQPDKWDLQVSEEPVHQYHYAESRWKGQRENDTERQSILIFFVL